MSSRISCFSPFTIVGVTLWRLHVSKCVIVLLVLCLPTSIRSINMTTILLLVTATVSSCKVSMLCCQGAGLFSVLFAFDCRLSESQELLFGQRRNRAGRYTRIIGQWNEHRIQITMSPKHKIYVIVERIDSKFWVLSQFGSLGKCGRKIPNYLLLLF